MTIFTHWNGIISNQQTLRKCLVCIILTIWENYILRNSLAVQRLGLHALTAEAQVQSLFGELISHKPCSQKKKTQPYQSDMWHWWAICTSGLLRLKALWGYVTAELLLPSPAPRLMLKKKQTIFLFNLLIFDCFSVYSYNYYWNFPNFFCWKGSFQSSLEATILQEKLKTNKQKIPKFFGVCIHFRLGHVSFLLKWKIAIFF